MDWIRLLEFTECSDWSFEVGDYFEFLVTAHGVLCDELMCPDTGDVNLRIAFMMALGLFKEVEECHDFIKLSEALADIQRAL